MASSNTPGGSLPQSKKATKAAAEQWARITPISCLMIMQHRQQVVTRSLLFTIPEKIVSLKIFKPLKLPSLIGFFGRFAQTSLHDVTKIDDRTNKLFWVDKERMLGDRNTLEAYLKLMASNS